jgi:hypothetical protein
MRNETFMGVLVISAACAGCGAAGERAEPSDAPAVDETFEYGAARSESWLFVVDDRADEAGAELRAAFFEELERVETDPNRGCRQNDPAAPRPMDRRVAFATPSGGMLVEAPELDLRSDRVSDPDIGAWIRAVEARSQAQLTADTTPPFRFLETLSNALASRYSGSGVVVAVTAREDESTGPASDYAVQTSAFGDVVLTAQAPRLASWASASRLALGELVFWKPGEPLRLSRLSADCATRCVQPRPSCRLFVIAEVDQCPEELGWREFLGQTTSDGRRECEVRELAGQELERCQYDLHCNDCPSGFCRTKVTELVEECRARSAEPLPRLVGEAAGVGLRASFRFVCD